MLSYKMEWWLYVLIFVVVCLAANFILWTDLSGLNYKGDPHNSFKRNPLLPPGWMIGVIWVIIFGFFGYASYLLYKENDGVSVAFVAIIVAAVFCLLYPVFIYFAAKGDPSKYEKYARVLNLLALIVAFVLALLVIRESDSAFWFIVPFLVWSSYVNFADSVYMNFRYKEPFQVAYVKV